MQYDGSVIIDTKISADGIEKGFRMLKNEVGSVGDAAKRSGEKVSAAFSGAKINKTLENARHKVAQLEEQLRNLSTKHKFAIAADDDKGASKVGAQMERVYDKLAEARRKLALEVEAAAQQEAAAEEKAAERAAKAAQKEAQAVRRAQEKQAKEALKPVRRFESRMREIVSGALVFNVASSALRSMTEYFGSALMANQEFSESVADLRGSLLTAFQPVYEAVVPALSTLINWLNTATQVVARFFAAISGKSYKQMQENADALKDQADGLEAVGGAAKKAQRDLAGFDEINRLSGKDAGGGGGGTLNPPTFEEVDIPSSWETTIESLAMKVKDIFFTWDDLTPEIVAEKIVTSLGAVCGGFIGFSLGGPGGALIGMAIGAGLGVVLSNIVFNGDGQLTPDEILAALVAALLTLGGAAVGFAVGGPGGAALGATIGLGLTFTILDATFNDIDKNYNDLAEKVIEWSDNMARTTETGFIIPTYDDMKKLTDQIKEFFKGSSDDIIKNFDRTAILTEAGFVMPTHDEMKQLADKIKQFFEGASDDIIENFDRTAMLTESGFVVPTREEMEATAKLIKQKFAEAKDGIVSKWVTLSGWFKENVANPISNCFSNLGANIRGAWEKTFNWITDKLDSVYMFRRYGKRVGNPNLDRPYHWGQTTVRSILSNREYVGDTVNFKTYSKSNKLKKRLQNDPENILIFENTHEAIVDSKTFDLVQKHFAGRKRPDKQGEVDKFAGYVFCGDCGKRLYLHRGKTIKPENNAFQCGGFQGRTTDCTAHYIREPLLENVVLTNLKKMTAFAREKPDEFYTMAIENGEAEAKKFYDTVAQQRTQIQVRIKDLDNIIRCLYEDRVCGRITPERYDTMASGYEQEQAELKQELESITTRISEMDLREQYVREFMENAKTYIEMPKLTPELLRVFIRCIEVYEKEEKYSRTCGNTIVIHYTFQMPNPKAVTATMAATAVTADRKVA